MQIFFVSLFRDYSGLYPQLYCLDNHFTLKSVYQLPVAYFSVPKGTEDAAIWAWLRELEVDLYKFSYCVRSLRQYQQLANFTLIELAHDWRSSWRDLLGEHPDPATIAATRKYLNILPEKDPVQLELRIVTNSLSLKKQLRRTYKHTALKDTLESELPLVVKHSADLLANNKVVLTNNLLTLLNLEAEAAAEAKAYYQLIDYYYSKFVKRSPGQKFVFG